MRSFEEVHGAVVTVTQETFEIGLAEAPMLFHEHSFGRACGG